MTRDEAIALVRNGFNDDPNPEGWWHTDGGETYERLLTTLIDTHGLTPEAAFNILGEANCATAEEYGA